MAALRVLRPGLFTTVQDCGRWGYQAQGVPVSGAMDVDSHRVANVLVGNPAEVATLEVTLTGPQVEFGEACHFAVTGAEFALTLDDSPVPMNQVVKAEAGASLRFGARVRGARAYLAVTGGVDVPVVLGSRSTHLVSRMGGHEGRALRTGDVLKTGAAEKGAVPLFPERALFRRLPESGARLRVIAGSLMEHIAGGRFTISTNSDRMGYRLEGSAGMGSTSIASRLISSAVPTGAIQVLPSGQLILLMVDHATAGGYPIAGTVISADLPVAGQLAPGDWIEFEECSLQAADEALRRSQAALSRSAG
jgi:antagonist of KipI